MFSLRKAPRVLAGFALLATSATLSHAASAPTAVTAAATSVTSTSARLNGSVAPNGSRTITGFQWGTSTSYGSSQAGSPSSISAFARTTSVSTTISGLKCGTTYNARIAAQNSYGLRVGANVVFTTTACATTPPPSPTPVAPTASTSAPSSIAQTQATLRGSATAGSATATLGFDYGTSTAYGSTVGATPGSIAAGTGSTSISASLGGLACGTTYHYRARAASSAGTAVGSNQSFATAACSTPTPPPPPPPPPPSGTLDCALSNVRCVAPTSGPNQEYSTIQAAVNAAVAGDTVQVFDGNYVGFSISRSGTASARITVRAAGEAAVIDRVSSSGEGIRVSNASYVTIEGFKVKGMPGFGIGARGASPTSPMRGVTIRDNTVYDSASSNIYASQVTDSLIEGNTTYGSKDSHGIYLANGGSDNTVIRGNLAYGNANNGIHLNGDLSVGGDGLHSGVTIEDNVLHGNAANGMDLDGIQGSTIRNNVIYNNGRHGVRAFKVDAAAGPRDLTIVNNTIAVKSGSTPVKLTEDGGGHTIFNNVLVNEGTSGGSIVVGHASFKSDRNAFVNPGFSLNGGSSMVTLAQWRAMAGAYDTGSITSSLSALFAAASSRDYRLRSGSPAANAGVAAYNGRSAPAEDIAGVARPQGGAVDQGAYESF
jgi:parallel beta-helix repeat protein